MDFAELQGRIDALRSFMDVSRSTCGTITEVLDGVDEVLSEVSTDFAPFMSRTRRLRGGWWWWVEQTSWGGRF